MLSCFILFYFSLNSSPILSCSLSFYTGRSFYDLSLLCVEDGIRYSDSNSDLLTFGIVGSNPRPHPHPQEKKLVFLPLMWFCQVQCKDKHSSTHNLVPRVFLERERETWSLSLPLQRDHGNEVVAHRLLSSCLWVTAMNACIKYHGVLANFHVRFGTFKWWTENVGLSFAVF